MNWPLAIERNRMLLERIVAAMLALVGGRDGAGAITAGLRRAAFALLRPAEAAVRRLIVIAARGLEVRLGLPRPPPLVAAGAGAGGGRVPAFPLLDPAKRYAPLSLRREPRGEPRIRTFWSHPALVPASAKPIAIATPPPAKPVGQSDPDALVEAGMLRLRLAALELALADLPRQAQRLARHLARAKAKAGPGARPPRPPLRFGRPPGWRLKPTREVDFVLRECHALAMDAARADTS